MATKESTERSRRLLKRDYNRIIDEINKLIKSTITLEVVEQLDTLRLSIAATKEKFDDMYYKYMELLEPKEATDTKLEDELLRERDAQFINIDKAISVCNVAKRKFEGQSKRDSLNASVTVESHNLSSAKLPKINVPTFNGDFRKFLDFKALYENLVHNDDNIPPVRKMHYLKESLVDEATATLANLAVSEDGYKEAWSRVIAKYDNKRLIIHTHFNDLFAAEKLKSESNLRLLVDRFDSAIRGLRICNVNPDNWSPILAYMMYTRLDPKTRSDFDNQTIDNATYFAFKTLFKFCETRAHNIEARKFEEMPPVTPVPKLSATSKPATSKRSFLTAKSSCIACKEQHLLIDCNMFKSISPSERLNLVRANKMCVNCFSRLHTTSACPSPKRCRNCAKAHHTLLHLPGVPKPNPVSSASTTEAKAITSAAPTSNTETKFSSNVSVSSNKKFIMLPSALVRFECEKVSGLVRILIDDCSQPTLISDAFVRKFRLPISKIDNNNPVHGVGFDNLNVSHSCKLLLTSRINSFGIDIEAEVIPAAAIRYTVNSVSWKECPDRFREIKNYQLADPAFYSPSPNIDNIDILLGAEFSELCKINESVQIEQLTLRNTQFGWTLIGKFPAVQSDGRASFLTTQQSIMNIDAQLSRFWEIENVSPSDKSKCDADQCEQHFQQTTTRATNGQFVVRLPFKMSPSVLAPNCASATAHFLAAENRRNASSRAQYNEFLTEYVNLGHMTKVESNGNGYFIPHHAVLKPTSTTTQTRVVFNASFKTASNFSLNDVLLVGPQLQPDLFDALVRFSNYAVVFTADISKMYRCVWVHPDDRIHQKIIWRPTPDSTVAEYELNTVTYGTAPASFLATRCLKRVAEMISTDHPVAAAAIEGHFYMDDLLTGCDTVEEADQLRRTIHDNLAAVGFQLRKYQTNSPELLATIPAEMVETNSSREFGDSWAVSILGLFWEPSTDTLRIRVSNTVSHPQPITKRRILSEMSKIFDPLGLVSPFTIKAKLFLQKVWKEGVNWDDFVSDTLAQEVQEYLSEIPQLSNFRIPRPCVTTTNTNSQLIGFCDASDKAYCACVYLRQTTTNADVSSRLICTKTRVAPLKALTIPRLELQGALLLTELCSRVTNILNIHTQNVFLFCDSEVVLAWLAKPDHHWDVFVKNRVQKIAEVFPYKHWSFVGTKDNPADLGTRGVPAKVLINSNLWSNGPPFLLATNCCRLRSSLSQFSTTVEEKKVIKACFQVANHESETILNRFSKYSRLIAVIGRIIQWVRRWRLTQQPENKDFLDTSLAACINSARIAAIRIVQAHAYAPELDALRQSKSIHPKSSLRHIDPFIDENGLLRVTGRLQNSEFSYARKHPIGLPKNCHFLQIYIDHLHVSFCHANKDFIQRFILAEFYPIGGIDQLIKSRIRKCLICLRFKAETYNQVMGRLPAARVKISRPFAHTGIDFCGPFRCKCLGHRATKFNKVYACIFICMVTRAVHIETASDLSSTIFLMALHRFVARRGLPATLYSDRGTNFVGAKNYLNFSDEQIQNFVGLRQIKWHFNPPHSPHRGGLWEAAVKAAKSHLKRVILDQPLNFEEYVTIFSRIEAILNSRPLCYRRSSSKNEDFVLTPNHFLIGESPFQLPEPEDTQAKLPLLSRYNFVRSILNGFWKFWRADYLNMLQRKEKWIDREKNVQVGQIVLVKSPTPPTQWPLARVEIVHPDQDGFVRTVTIRLKEKLCCTDIRSLIKLPDANEQ